MNREDVRKLLGGYATGTLTAAEQEALFAAALEDQELFDALMKEEALREVLDDPGARADVLRALDRLPERASWWQWRPLIGALAMAGVALAVVAVWRGTRPAPAPVMVAQVQKAPEARPAAEPPHAAPPARAKTAPKPDSASPAAAGKVSGGPRDEKASVPDVDIPAAPAPPPAQAKPALAVETGNASRDLKGAAAGAATARQQLPQQMGQLAAPSPRVQQQQLPQAAPTVDRTAAISSFRANNVTEVAALEKEKKAAPLLQWTILRGDAEAPPDTVLDTGEIIRLRVVSLAAGTVRLTEGETVLASATVAASRPFDTPPIPYTTPGPRRLRLTVSTDAARPLTLNLTLQYAK